MGFIINSKWKELIFNMKKENQKKLKWLGFQKKERIERIQMLKDNGYLTDEFEQILKKNLYFIQVKGKKDKC